MTLHAATPENGQTYRNNLSALSDKLFLSVIDHFVAMERTGFKVNISTNDECVGQVKYYLVLLLTHITYSLTHYLLTQHKKYTSTNLKPGVCKILHFVNFRNDYKASFATQQSLSPIFGKVS